MQQFNDARRRAAGWKRLQTLSLDQNGALHGRLARRTENSTTRQVDASQFYWPLGFLCLVPVVTMHSQPRCGSFDLSKLCDNFLFQKFRVHYFQQILD